MKLYFTIFSLIFVILMWGLYVDKLRFDVKEQDHGKGKLSDLLFLLGLALVVKCFWSVLENGFETDINCFKVWSQWVFESGIGKFYYLDGFTDYPPGYMYVLYVIAAIRKLFGVALDSKVSIFLLKLFPIVCDLIAGALIYKISRIRWNHRKALLFVAVYVFNPAVVLNSSVWGQVDSVFILCVFATCYFCMVEKRGVAYFLFALGVLVKPQTLIFAPVLIFTFFDQVILRDFSWKKCVRDVLLGFAAIVSLILASAPFGLEKVFPQYAQTITSYPYATVNAYNFWTILGKNWQPQTDHFLFLTCQQWGTIAIVASVVLGAWSFFKFREKKEKYFISAAIIISTLFIFSVRMHERYLFPVVILLLAVYVLQPKKEFFVAFVGMGTLHFLNVADVFGQSFQSKTSSQFSVFSNLIAIGTVIIYVYFIFHCLGQKKEGKTVWKHSWQKDLIVFGSILAVYCAFAFYDLGKMQAPKTEFRAAEDNASTITLDLGTQKNLSDLYVYLGNLENRKFTIQFGNDNKLENWSAVGDVTFDSVFQWDKGSIVLDTESGEGSDGIDSANQYRYIRLISQDDLSIIRELVILDSKGKPIVPVNASQYKPLFDEQFMFPKEVTFREGTYFDEIYHARTAYEMVKGEYCYENTHPPLGKEIISIGIRIFGMNPFGWRIMGTLFGVFMLPFMFLFAKKLFEKTWVAGIVTFLFAFDFMHFVQTRIATIDVFVTFFVLVMYYFMYCYIQKDFYEGPFYRNWLPLGLCGVSMGLGFASKWTAIYAGCGLGLIFLATMCCRAKEYVTAKKTQAGFERVKDFPKRIGLTLLFCVLFFILIPAIIYTLSYLGFSDGSKDNFIVQMLHNQKSMFDYHSNLVATHPYSSWWYQWPTMVRPVFYYCHTLASGLREGISAFGNPLVWWASVPAAIFMLYRSIRYRDTKALFLLVGYLAQYMPWMFVSRITFAYHYFPSIVFAVLMIGYTMYVIVGNQTKRIKYMVGYALAAGLLFLMFYPILSGQPVAFDYVVESLRWLGGWVFAL